MRVAIGLMVALILLGICSMWSAGQRTNKQIEPIDYRKLIEVYLDKKVKEPTVTVNNNGRHEFDVLKHKISWKEKQKGIQVTVDGKTFSTTDKMTLNDVWGSKSDSVNFANFLQQIKIYEQDSLIGIVLTNQPCTGLGCGVNYQILYDLKSERQSYFGRFRTGFELELYDFNNDNTPDYLSKTFYGRNAKAIDTTVFVMFSITKRGDFQEYKTEKQKRFWFKLVEPEFGIDNDPTKQGFEEHWINKIRE